MAQREERGYRFHSYCSLSFIVYPVVAFLRLARSRSPKPVGFGAGEAQARSPPSGRVCFTNILSGCAHPPVARERPRQSSVSVPLESRPLGRFTGG